MKNSIFLLVLLFLSISIKINSQWVQVSDGMGNNRTVTALKCTGKYLFAGTTGQGMFLSANNGGSWIHTSSQLQYINSLTIKDNIIFAGASDGVYSTRDNGANWRQTTLHNHSVWSLAANGNTLFAGTEQYGLVISYDDGKNWLQTGLHNQFTIYSLESIGSSVFAGTWINGIYISTDYGYSWVQTSLNNLTVGAITSNGNSIFAGTRFSNGIYRSTNNGLEWTQTSLNSRTIYSLAASGNIVFAGSDFYGFYVSSNNGETWIQKNEGLGDFATIFSLCVYNDYIFAGLSNRSVWRRSISELVGIQPVTNEIPNQFSISQNYPNPFNPTTKIQFQIPKSGFVNMLVYDVLGREIETLVNEELNPGTYEAEWDASNQPSGIYYYKIIVGDYTQTKKMILIK